MPRGTYTIQVKGLKELQARLKKANTSLTKEVGAELKQGANDMVAEAKSRAPKDTGFLWNEISNSAIDQLHYEVVSGAIYSPFMEFGTRTLVEIPEGLEEFASQFIKLDTGTSLEAKEAIFEWCRRKGVKKDLWFWIFLKIMTVGVKPRPFFFPALAKVTPEIINKVKNVLNDI